MAVHTYEIMTPLYAQRVAALLRLGTVGTEPLKILTAYRKYLS